MKSSNADASSWQKRRLQKFWQARQPMVWLLRTLCTEVWHVCTNYVRCGVAASAVRWRAIGMIVTAELQCAALHCECRILSPSTSPSLSSKPFTSNVRRVLYVAVIEFITSWKQKPVAWYQKWTVQSFTNMHKCLAHFPLGFVSCGLLHFTGHTVGN